MVPVAEQYTTQKKFSVMGGVSTDAAFSVVSIAIGLLTAVMGVHF